MLAVILAIGSEETAWRSI